MRGSGGAGDVRSARWAIGLAAGAVLLGHGITYTLVHPDGHERAGVLASTGHAYLHLLEGPGLALTIASMLAVVLLGAGRLGAAPGRAALFRRLAAIQVAAFAVMEVGERAAAGTGVGAEDVLLFGLGLAVQLGLSWLGACLLRWLRRGGELVAATLAATPASLPRPPFRFPLRAAPVLTGRAVAAPAPGRGPPPVAR